MTAIQKRLNEYVNAELDYWDFSGVVRITKNGNTVYETCRGYANLEFDIENTMATRFCVASVTKQFTAFAIMLLYDKGLLKLHECANQYLPANLQLPANITVHNLLCHTSGLHNNYNFEDDFYVYEDRLPYDKETFFKKWILNRPIGEAGKNFEYNNSNYVLLAWIIEHLSGQTYHDFLFANIFSPLGMNSSSYDNGQSIIKNKAGNYLHDYGVLVKAPYTNNLFGIGAGSLVTTCGDLQRWYECLKNRELLSTEAYELYFAENKNHYCYGLERYEENGTVKYAHGGDFLGVSAYTQYYFDEDLCIIIIANAEALDQYRFGNALAAIMHNGEAEPSRRAEEIAVTPAELEQYTGTYLPGKIQVEQKDGKLYLVRVNQNIHIEVYCVEKHCFKRRYEEQQTPYCLLQNGAAKPSLWGYELMSKEAK